MHAQAAKFKISGMALPLPSYFTDFLRAIRLTADQEENLISAHRQLRQRLLSDDSLKGAIVTTFLQGSYRRRTSLQPSNGQRSDVDVVVVSRLSEREFTPKQALALFAPFVERHYPNQGRAQGRSIGIKTPDADMDLVITSSPATSELGLLESLADDNAPEDDEEWMSQPGWAALLGETKTLDKGIKQAGMDAEWKAAPLRIPDCDAERWEDTHPIAQIEWTRRKSKRCNGHFVSIVRAIKWWKYCQHPEPPKPRSYPLERMIAEFCPDGPTSISEGVVNTLEAMARGFVGHKPCLPDHGTGADVLARMTELEFQTFRALLPPAARIARRAFESTTLGDATSLWRELFGDRFPTADGTDGGPSGGGFTRRDGPSDPDSGRFA